MSKEEKGPAQYPTMNGSKKGANQIKQAPEARHEKKDESAEQWIKNRLVEAYQWKE